MVYIIIIFVLYSIKIVNCESYNKYSGYSIFFNSRYSRYSGNIGYSIFFNSGYSGYSGYSRYSGNIGYSNFFNSGYSGNIGYSRYSGNIGYSNFFNSRYSGNIGYSKSTNQKYLTFYNSYDLQSSQSYYNFFSNSQKKSNSIWGYLSVINSYTLPVSKTYSNVISFSTTSLPTLIPTSLPTQDSEQFIPILSFETSMTLSGLTEPLLDTKAQSALVIALASSINISKNYVLFLGQEIITRRKLIIRHLLSTYNIKGITQINIPLTNHDSNINPATIYTSLTTN